MASVLPTGSVSAEESESSKRNRAVYLHAQQGTPTDTPAVSTLYTGEEANIYFAVKNPNRGAVDNGEHTEPQFDLNGYSISIYFDPDYFDFIEGYNASCPIDYHVENSSIDDGGSLDGDSEDIKTDSEQIGYWLYTSGTGSEKDVYVNGKAYNRAYITVFFGGAYLPNTTGWLNLCKLPLKVKNKTGSTKVFFDTTGGENSLQLFAKNNSTELSDQTFTYNAIGGEYHSITIKDRATPSAPMANPPEGKYTTAQSVTLTAEDGCTIYYKKTNDQAWTEYRGTPIQIDFTTKITCYAQRNGKKSSEVTYTYEIVPTWPYLFVNDPNNPGTKKKIESPSYSEYDTFTVWAATGDTFEEIPDGCEIFYTFSNAPTEDISDNCTTDPDKAYTEWVKIAKRNHTEQGIQITKGCTMRLVTKKLGELSTPNEYRLGIKPDKVSALSPEGTLMPSGVYGVRSLDIVLSCPTTGAEIYYTTDNSDPTDERSSSRQLYTPGDKITVSTDTTIRAAAKFDGIFGDISSYYYILSYSDEYGVDAFYPPGTYESSVDVTLTARNPEYKIQYDDDDGTGWRDYTKTLTLTKSTKIKVRVQDNEDDWHETAELFSYTIRPYPPEFSHETTQFTNADTITVSCTETTPQNTDRYELFYTLDGSDPITSASRIPADPTTDKAEIKITGYTVVKAVVLKDGNTYSTVVTHSYDIVTAKPTMPIMTLTPGGYTHKIGDDNGFETQFVPVLEGTEIYYTITTDGTNPAEPVPNTSGVIKYTKYDTIDIKGHTAIRAVAVNAFGTASDVALFEYTVTPEAPQAAPSSASIGADKLPLVPVTAVKGCRIFYEIGDPRTSDSFSADFVCEDGSFYIDTNTGTAYKNSDGTEPLTVEGGLNLTNAELKLSAELDGVKSMENTYVYRLGGSGLLAAPYADKTSGEYEEIAQDSDSNLLYIRLYSLNSGDTIEYKLNDGDWTVFTEGSVIKIKTDTVLQTRSTKGGIKSTAASYVYSFAPLAPIITLASGRYVKTPAPETQILYDNRAPADKINSEYTIMFRPNGDSADRVYGWGSTYEIDHTMSLKAYVVNNVTGRSSKNVIHYYIIESNSTATGSVYLATPYHGVTRMNAALLAHGDENPELDFAGGIRLLTASGKQIQYYYSYTMEDGKVYTTNTADYDNIPITVNPKMTGIKITAWLRDGNDKISENQDFEIEFVHLKTPVITRTQDAKYTISDDYPGDETVLLYYTTDGSDPTDENNEARQLYTGTELSIAGSVTIRAAYMSACGKCGECRKANYEGCSAKVYSDIGEYTYTAPTVITTGGGGGGGTRVVDKTKTYTKDIFGVEHSTHISYIKGYPDGSVMPDGDISREEIAAVLYRITSHEYEKPFIATGEVFPDVEAERWSAHDIEYMAEKEVVSGYPDGEFKPQGKLTRAEFAALIFRFAGLENTATENPFSDMDKSHWGYEYVLALAKNGIMDGYEDGEFKPENRITRAEAMTAINKILGRNPSDAYVKSLNLNPYTDLQREKWYYTAVMEATVTHDYSLNKDGVEITWDNWK